VAPATIGVNIRVLAPLLVRGKEFRTDHWWRARRDSNPSLQIRRVPLGFADFLTCAGFPSIARIRHSARSRPPPRLKNQSRSVASWLTATSRIVENRSSAKRAPTCTVVSHCTPGKHLLHMDTGDARPTSRSTATRPSVGLPHAHTGFSMLAVTAPSGAGGTPACRHTRW